MTAARFQTRHLCGTNIKGVGTSSERSGAAAKLVMRLQQRDAQSFMGEQCSGGETGNAPTDHDHVLD